MPTGLPSERYLIIGIVYLLLELWLGNKTKYRSVVVTTAIFAIFFAFSMVVVLSLKLKGIFMEKKKLDIKNVKEVLEFGYEIYLCKDVIGNGLDLSKLPAHLVPLYTKAIPAIEDIGQVVPEMQDLDAEESAELIALIASKGVASEEQQRVIAKSLSLAISAYNLVKEIQD
jgi:hypothetical protein